MSSHNPRVARAVHYALIAATTAGVGSYAVPASAQEAELEQVVVTGSRIRIRDFEAISPVTSVGAEAIAATGSLTVDQVLNTLPQVVPGFTATSNNPGDGTATVDLRGLGPERTLVLMNGRRLNPSTNTGRTDLNNVPTRLIERVEVVTGGASAVYGSDALAGVVNFILKDDFEGVDISTHYGITDEGDGDEKQIDLLLGGNFADDRGNLTGYASYYDREGILQADRSYTRVDRNGGSLTGVAGRFDNVGNNPFPEIVNDVGATVRNYAFNPDGSVRGHINLLPETNGGVGDRYNFAPVNYMLTPSEKYSLGAFGHYTFSEYAEAYTELLYVDSQQPLQLAPTPATGVLVSATSPVLSPSAQALLAARPDPDAPAVFRRRMVEIGPRGQENNSALQQMIFGVRGSLPFKDWEYDTYYTYGKTKVSNYTTNDVSSSRFQAAIDGCPADYAQYVTNCVPIDPFGEGRISEQAANFVRLNFADELVFERNLAAAAINGTVVELPAGPLGFAAGLEYREDSSDYRPDQAKKDGDIQGFNAQQPIRGKFDVVELFGEAVIPLVKDVTGIESLSAELGVRFSDYSSIGNVEAYKGGLTWEPFDSFRVRGMYQRAVRAPSVFELFQAGDQGFPQYNDPCAGATDPALVAFCVAQGVSDPANFEQPNTQVEAFSYGNPDLTEETSDTYTFGLVWQPSFVNNLSMSLDYYDIKVTDYIGTLRGGAQGIIDACFATLDLNSPDCFFDPLNLPFVYRDPLGTEEMKVTTPTGNVSELRTKGIDLQVNYGIPVGNTINTSLLVTYLDTYELDGIDYTGTTGGYNILGSFPEYKANLRMGYQLGPVGLNYNLQYIDSMDNQGNIPAFEDGGYKGASSFVYHDVSAVWDLNDTFQLTFGINNVLDEEPPGIDFGVDMNTDPGTYDMLGRRYFGVLRARF